MKGRSLAEVLIGAAVLFVAVGFLGYALLHGGRAPVTDGVEYAARFDKVDGLAAGSDVRIAGVKVGSVSSLRIDPATYQAEVVIRVAGNIRLPTDSSAEITSEGLLGGKYVSLVPGGSDRMLAAGARITETQGSVSLESLLGRFIFSVTQMNQGGGGEAPAGGEAARPR